MEPKLEDTSTWKFSFQRRFLKVLGRQRLWRQKQQKEHVDRCLQPLGKEGPVFSHFGHLVIPKDCETCSFCFWIPLRDENSLARPLKEIAKHHLPMDIPFTDTPWSESVWGSIEPPIAAKTQQKRETKKNVAATPKKNWKTMNFPADHAWPTVGVPSSKLPLSFATKIGGAKQSPSGSERPSLSLHPYKI